MSLLDDAKAFIGQYGGYLAAGGAGVAAGSVLGAATASALSSSGPRKRRKSNSKARKKNRSKSKRVRRTPRTAGKGKDTSTRRIRYTKNGQPYVIMRSGKAKFIKKTGARRSHRTAGGRY